MSKWNNKSTPFRDSPEIILRASYISESNFIQEPSSVSIPSFLKKSSQYGNDGSDFPSTAR